MFVMAALTMVTLVTTTAASHCEWGFSSTSSGNCYRVVNEVVMETWNNARTYCRRNFAGVPADLVTFDSLLEENSVVPKDSPWNYWIGLSDRHQQGTYRWLDGMETDFTNWGPGQPSDMNTTNCVAIGAFNGNWSEMFCETALPFICGYVPTGQAASEEQGMTDETTVSDGTETNETVSTNEGNVTASEEEEQMSDETIVSENAEINENVSTNEGNEAVPEEQEMSDETIVSDDTETNETDSVNEGNETASESTNMNVEEGTETIEDSTNDQPPPDENTEAENEAVINDANEETASESTNMNVEEGTETIEDSTNDQPLPDENTEAVNDAVTNNANEETVPDENAEAENEAVTNNANEETAEKTCLPEWDKLGEVGCVKIVDDKKRSWHDARVKCQEMGADLIVVPDETTHKFLRSYFFKERRERRRYWFGLNQEEARSEYRWLDGELKDPTFSRWCSQKGLAPDHDPRDHPERQCGMLVSGKNGKWNTANCEGTEIHYSICMEQSTIDKLMTPPTVVTIEK